MKTRSSRKILILQGHPDASQRHLGHRLAQAYAAGAVAGGHTVQTIEVAGLDFPLLRSQQEWEKGELPASLRDAQAAIGAADHLVLFFPLWLGDMPALLKGFLEQVARPGFAFKGDGGNPFGRKGLAGKSARVVVTMGMPAFVYRFFFAAHSVKSLERNILGFVGVAPVRETLVGSVEGLDDAGRAAWFAKLEALGRRAA